MRTRWLWPSLLGSILILWSYSAGAGQDTLEWKLEVSVDSASIHLKPDADSPIIATVPKGTILKSYAKDDEWFRVIPEPGQEGIVNIGYIALTNVSVLEEKTRKSTDFWQFQSERFRGIGLTVKFGGGVNTLARGDIDKGALGIFDSGVANIASHGFTLFSKTAQQFRSRHILGADITLRLSSRFGLGVGADQMLTSAEYYQQFGRDTFSTNTLVSNPRIDLISIRLILRYEFPIGKLLRGYLDGGPSLNLADYVMGFSSPAGGEFEDTMVQDAKGRAYGLWGAAGFEFAVLDRLGFFVEAQARYAKIQELKGSEWFEHWANYQSTSSRTEGFLYLLEGETFPRLAILSDSAAAGQDARKVAFDITGFGIVAGLKMRF